MQAPSGRSPPLCFALALTALSCAVHAANFLPMDLIVRGSSSGLGGAEATSGEQTLVLKDQEAWSRLWQQHVVGMMPAPALPDVDFGTQIVVAVVRFCHSGGFGLSVTAIEEAAEHLTVHYETLDPREDAMTTMALTQPYEFVAIPRTDKQIRFAKHAAEPPPAPSTYLLTLKDQGRAPADVVAEIQAMSGVTSVEHLKSAGVCIVQLEASADASAVAAIGAINGVETIERDM